MDFFQRYVYEQQNTIEIFFNQGEKDESRISFNFAFNDTFYLCL